MRRFRPFQVRLPSGDRYWTVVDAAYRPVAEADEWLLHVRLGRDRAESTTEAYARSLALFLDWCARAGSTRCWPRSGSSSSTPSRSSSPTRACWRRCSTWWRITTFPLRYAATGRGWGCGAVLGTSCRSLHGWWTLPATR